MSSMKAKAKKLSIAEITLLRNHLSPTRFPEPCDLVYEDQVPNIGIVLLEGEAFLTRKKKILESIEPGTVLGIQELIENVPVRYGCKLGRNASVLLLQKSELPQITKVLRSMVC